MKSSNANPRAKRDRLFFDPLSAVSGGAGKHVCQEVALNSKAPSSHLSPPLVLLRYGLRRGPQNFFVRISVPRRDICNRGTVDDQQLLTSYLQTSSQEVFAQIVHRHIDLVYSCALRQTRDRDLSDDITQAVFCILARRAGSIRDRHLLTGWLVRTTRYAALNAMKYQSRRRQHELQAAAMKSQLYIDAVPPADVASVLHETLSHLSLKDRSVIALRYFHGKTVRDVGSDMGISEHAAQKRITRALERIRGSLARRGIKSPADATEAVLAGQFMQAAPVTLLPNVLASAFNPGILSTASIIATRTLSNLRAAAIKPVLGAALAASVLVAVAVAILPASAPVARAQSRVARADTPVTSNSQLAISTTKPADDSAPLPLPAAVFVLNTRPDEFDLDTDAAVHHVSDASHRLHSETTNWGRGAQGLCGVDLPSRFLGKRIRFSAYVKSENLVNWGGLGLFALAPGQRIVISDDMGDRPLTGTTDWKQLTIVCDLPRETASLLVGLNMHGKGTLWMDGAQIEIVDKNVSITDNQTWHSWSFTRPHYTQSLDPNTQHNGHPTICLESSTAKNSEWFAWDRDDRHVEQYLGKRMRITAWIKTENVTMPSGFSIRVLGFPNNTDIQKETALRTIRGTTDWKKYSLECNIPDGAFSICSGIRLYGKGKLWLDDIQYEILDAKPAK
jgi:RNA polymerase sigma factor (sigma-70 family)